MVAPVYDHVTALIFACTLFVSAVVAVPAISYVNLFYVDQQQLRNVALEALNSMLLSMGYPSNWGSIDPFKASKVGKFGLALSETSCFYVLDPEKVQRLNINNPTGSLDYKTVRDLLRLQGYSFNFRIMPLFKVALDDGTVGNHLFFKVKVRFNEGGPIPKASVTATILYASEIQGKENKFNFTTLVETETNELGECTISYTLPSDFVGYILVLRVTVAHMATVTVPYIKGACFAQNVAHVSIIGDNVTVHIPENQTGFNPPRSAERRIYNIASVTEGEVSDIYDGLAQPVTETHVTWGKGFYYWTHSFTGLSYENPLYLIFNIWVPIGKGGGGRQLVFFATSPLFSLASGVLELEGQPSPQSASGAVIQLCRTVEIAGMTYLVEFLLWKET